MKESAVEQYFGDSILVSVPMPNFRKVVKATERRLSFECKSLPPQVSGAKLNKLEQQMMENQLSGQMQYKGPEVDPATGFAMMRDSAESSSFFKLHRTESIVSGGRVGSTFFNNRAESSIYLQQNPRESIIDEQAFKIC